MAGFKHPLPLALLPSVSASVSSSEELAQTQGHQNCHSFFLGSCSATPLSSHYLSCGTHLEMEGQESLRGLWLFVRPLWICAWGTPGSGQS